MTLNETKEALRKLPLAVPMAAATMGTAISLLTKSARMHTMCGAVCLAFSAMHTWQHANKLNKDFKRGLEKMGIMDYINIPKSKIDMFIRTVEVASFIPGRARLYSKALVGDEEKAKKVLNYLRSYSELSEVDVNSATGSILIKYTPQLLHTNKELTKVEEYIKTHVRG